MNKQTVLNAIGNTPLVRVHFDSPATIFAKLEYANPGGSVKDRSALFMIEHAEKNGLLKPGGTIIDASSGNQGIAVAMIGAVKGYRVIITVSEKISEEKRNTLRAYGAHVVTCPSTSFLEDPQSYHSKALEIHRNTPNSFMPNQYFNLLNAQAHETLLGPEIWQQTQGTITHFFAGAGTGGTVSGAGLFLKKQKPSLQVLAVDSAVSFRSTNGNPQPYKLEGLGVDFKSPVLNDSVIDTFCPVTDDQAITMLNHLARNHGLLVGPSSGAVAHSVATYAKKLTAHDVVVMIFGDSGRAYLSKGFYGQEYESLNIPHTTSPEPLCESLE
jgi:cystathionine beta-synthase